MDSSRSGAPEPKKISSPMMMSMKLRNFDSSRWHSIEIAPSENGIHCIRSSHFENDCIRIEWSGWIERLKKVKDLQIFQFQHGEYSVWKWFVSANALIPNHIRTATRTAAPLAKHKHVLHFLRTIFYWNIKAIKWVCWFYCCTAIQRATTANNTMKLASI